MMLESIKPGRMIPMPWDSSTVNMEKYTRISVVTDLPWASRRNIIGKTPNLTYSPTFGGISVCTQNSSTYCLLLFTKCIMLIMPPQEGKFGKWATYLVKENQERTSDIHINKKQMQLIMILSLPCFWKNVLYSKGTLCDFITGIPPEKQLYLEVWSLIRCSKFPNIKQEANWESWSRNYQGLKLR